MDRVQADGRAPAAPVPLWWAHWVACAWTAAWLTARGRAMQGSIEIDADDSWRGDITWDDGRGSHTVGHRPDLAWLPASGSRGAIEVEISRKETRRLDAILELHARWRNEKKTAGVLYIVGSAAMRPRIAKVAQRHGLTLARGGGLRVESLDEIRRQAWEAHAKIRAGTRRGARARTPAVMALEELRDENLLAEGVQGPQR